MTKDINRPQSPPTQAEMEADRLAAVLSDENYKKTVGAWIVEIQDQALRDVMTKTDVEAERAKGAYSAIEELKNRIELAMAKREALAAKKRNAYQKLNVEEILNDRRDQNKQ